MGKKRSNGAARPYQRHRLTRPMRAVRNAGMAAIDRRTRLWRDIQMFREGLIEDLGGDERLSAQQIAVIELAVIDRTLLMMIDGFLFGEHNPDNPVSNLINKRNRTLYPIVRQRQQIADAFTLSIVHGEGERSEPLVVQDLIRGWSRRGGESPELVGVVEEIAALCKTYRVRTVTGDRYAAGWVRQAFEESGTTYRASKLDKSAAYLEALPLFSQGRVRLLDHPQQTRELQCLERRTRAGGKDVIDHPRGGHDDYANALALATVAATSRRESATRLAPVSLTRVSPWKF